MPLATILAKLEHHSSRGLQVLLGVYRRGVGIRMPENTPHRVQVASLSPELGGSKVSELVGTPTWDLGLVACPVDRTSVTGSHRHEHRKPAEQDCSRVPLIVPSEVP